FRIELFSNSGTDKAGAAEGQTFLGFVDVTTDASGDATFSFAAGPLATGSLVTATATDNTTHTTSLFSQPVTVQTPPPPPPPQPHPPPAQQAPAPQQGAPLRPGGRSPRWRRPAASASTRASTGNGSCATRPVPGRPTRGTSSTAGPAGSP